VAWLAVCKISAI